MQEENEELDIEKLQQDLETAQTESLKNLNGWQRAQADFENYQKRKEGESQELITFAREVAVVKLLPTLDSLQQALLHRPQATDQLNPAFREEYQTWQNGVDGIMKQLDKALEELGVKKIEALGQKFDPHFHEAIREVESDQGPGMVVEDVQVGYTLGGKVIRPSQVVISK